MASLTWMLLLLVVALVGLHVFHARSRAWVWQALLGLGLAMLGYGGYLGLFWAPPEKEMGEVYRIIFMHVPQVWAALIALTINFVASVVFLFKKNWTSDALSEACAEVGLVMGGLGVLLGAIWAKPTWGVWWDWDPRLTTAAIMLVVYAGYLALRKFVDDPEKRATWSAVVAIIAFADLPILWFSVRWWRSLHQVQSNTQTVDPSMRMVLLWNNVAFLCLLFVLVWHRYQVAKATREREVALPSALPPSSNPTPEAA